MKLTIRIKLLLGFTVLLLLGALIQAFTFHLFEPLLPFDVNFLRGEAASLFLFCTLGLLILLCFIISDQLTKPIHKLQQSLDLIQQGKLQASPVIQSGDEIEALSVSFSSLIGQISQREHALKQDNQEIDIILQSLNEAVVALSPDGNIILFNKIAEQISGLPAATSMGQKIDAVLHFYDDQTSVPFATYADQSEHMKKRLVVRGLETSNAEGKKILISITVSPLIFENMPAGYILTFHDLSKERELEEMKLDFVSMAAHELRTPLTAIRGYASLMELQYTKQLDTPGKDLMKKLSVSVNTLSNLVDNLLSVSKIERNAFIMDIKPTDIIPIIKTSVDSLRQTANTRQQHLLLNVPAELPVVFADEFRIGQVILNLVSNAISYSPPGSTITISAEKHEGSLQISVQDTGEGIPPEAMPKLFTKFFRVTSGNMEEVSKGTGLGLFIARAIVEMHKGKIWAESTVGKGSSFTFTLPTASPQAIGEYQQDAKQTDLTGKPGQSIIKKITP